MIEVDEIQELRDKTVRKANELIQRSRYNDLSTVQQKIVLYLISQISPYDEDFKLYQFSTQTFCRVCGLDATSGKNYNDLKEALKGIADKSIWIALPDGRETLLRWIEKPYIDQGSGTIAIKMDADMKPYLLQLKSNYTQYELIYTLHFRSRYTIRLYELLKSCHYNEQEEYTRRFELDELRRIMGAEAETYQAYKAFKQQLLTRTIKEINQYSDKTVSFTEIKQGRRVAAIEFTIETKDILDRMKVMAEIDQAINDA